ncbi:MAG: hypothetical protein QOC96_2911 [Acidobacteriota bacterium]|jgi:hypothetical protein|nr:hypothetical protein [Acidobacteriota bacterium]
MKRKSTIISLVIALTLVSFACSKSGGSAANLSDDDKHKLFQAAGITQDPATIMQVTKALGLTDSSGQPTPAMDQFIKDHGEWGRKNLAWAQEYSDPNKAKEYVKSHMP